MVHSAFRPQRNPCSFRQASLSYSLSSAAYAVVDIIVNVGMAIKNANKNIHTAVQKRWLKNDITERQNVAEKWEQFNSKYAEKKPPSKFGSHFFLSMPCIVVLFAYFMQVLFIYHLQYKKSLGGPGVISVFLSIHCLENSVSASGNIHLPVPAGRLPCMPRSVDTLLRVS